MQNEAKKKSGIFYGWFVVIACMVMMAVIMPPMSTINSSLTPYVKDSLGISSLIFSARLLLMSVIGVAVSPFAGKYLARTNLNKALPLFVTAIGVCYAANFLAKNVFVFYAISIFTGAAFIFGGIMPITIIINNWFIEKRGFAMSITMAGIGLGSALISQIVEKLLERNTGSDWNWVYLVLGLLVLIVALPLSIFVVKARPEDKGLQPLGKAEIEAVNAGKVREDIIKNKGDLDRHVAIPFSEAKKKAFFKILILGIVAVGLFAGGAVSQLQPIIHTRFGLSVQTIMATVFSVVGIFGKLIQGWINDKYGIIPSSIYGVGITFISLILYFIAPTAAFVYLGASMYGLGTGISSLSAPLITGSIFKGKDYGAAYGIVSAFQSGAQAMGMVIFSAMFDKVDTRANPLDIDFNNHFAIIFVCLGILLVVALGSWILAVRSSYKYGKKEAKTV